MKYQGQCIGCERDNIVRENIDHSGIIIDNNVKLSLESSISMIYEHDDNSSLHSRSDISQEFETDILKRNILPSISYESNSIASSGKSINTDNDKTDAVNAPPIPEFVKYSDTITNICKTCYDDSYPAHVSCVTCNQKYHSQFLTRDLYEKMSNVSNRLASSCHNRQVE